jgi:signal peptide peptidase SppA
LGAILQIAAREGIGPEALQAQLGRPLENTRAVSVRDGVAVIPVTGPIFRYANCMADLSGDVTSTQVLRTDFETALQDPQVSAILFDLDSPGGEATSIGELANAIYQARGTKPIVSYVGGQASSAAYWIASATDQIIASPTAILGSIGVVMAYRDTRERDAKAGVKTMEFVSSQSPNKRPDLDTDEGKAQVQAVIDSLASVFVADVARNRGVDTATVLEKFGQGGVRVGQAAVDAGMADSLGSFESVLSDLCERSARGSGPSGTAYATSAALSGKGTQPMPSLWDQLKSALSGGAADEPEAVTPPAVEPTTNAENTAEVLKLRQQLAQMQERESKLQGEAMQREAEAFADGEVRANRAFPAERDALVAQYLQAAQDDAARPWTVHVKVGDAEAKSRVDLLKLQCAARPDHGLTQEQMPGNPAGGKALANQDTPDANKPDPARVKQLIALSPLRELADQNGKGN